MDIVSSSESERPMKGGGKGKMNKQIVPNKGIINQKRMDVVHTTRIPKLAKSLSSIITFPILIYII